jgi:(4S)-4-hydroxy-5-phosphonooxypentane-2,3-dione isomerase
MVSVGSGNHDRGREEPNMLAMWVKVRVKAAEHERFLQAIEADAIGSERDEPGCLRFNVLRDQQDPNVYYFFEVYRDEAALEAHRLAPHYAVWRAAADTLDGPAQATRCDRVFPAAAEYWEKRRSPA